MSSSAMLSKTLLYESGVVFPCDIHSILLLFQLLSFPITQNHYSLGKMRSTYKYMHISIGK